jgi:hypothetical protein
VRGIAPIENDRAENLPFFGDFWCFLVYLPSWLVRVGEGLRGEGESGTIFVFY